MESGTKLFKLINAAAESFTRSRWMNCRMAWTLWRALVAPCTFEWFKANNDDYMSPIETLLACILIVFLKTPCRLSRDLKIPCREGLHALDTSAASGFGEVHLVQCTP